MLGIDEFGVVDADEVDGELELVVETTADREWCQRCGVRALSKGRPVVVVRDVDAFDRPVRLRWRKRRWRCPESACEVTTWTEQTEAIRPRMALTERARARACRRVGRDGHSVAAVARDFGVGWQNDHARGGRARHAAGRGPDPHRRCRALGVDETSFLRAGPQRRTRFVTGLVDLRRSRLLDVVDGRAGSAVSRWLADREPGWLAAVERVALDPYRDYYNALIVGWTPPRSLSMPSTSCASATSCSTRSAAVCSNRRWATAVTNTTRSTASAGCC